MFRSFKEYVVLEPHIDDFELGCLPFILQEFKNSPLAVPNPTMVKNFSLHIITFCAGRSEEDEAKRREARLKTINILEELGMKVIWSFIPFKEKKRDTELDLRDINEATTFFTKWYKNENKKVLFIPQNDLHPDHCIVNQVGKIFSRDLKNIPVIEYIINNSKDNSYISETKWNIEISSLPNNYKSILGSIESNFIFEFDKLKNKNISYKYNLIKYNI